MNAITYGAPPAIGEHGLHIADLLYRDYGRAVLYACDAGFGAFDVQAGVAWAHSNLPERAREWGAEYMGAWADGAIEGVAIDLSSGPWDEWRAEFRGREQSDVDGPIRPAIRTEVFGHLFGNGEVEVKYAAVVLGAIEQSRFRTYSHVVMTSESIDGMTPAQQEGVSGVFVSLSKALQKLGDTPDAQPGEPTGSLWRSDY